MNKLLVICGPTATGKTDLALKLAAKYPADLISADSRQVYTGMDIGTGKDVSADTPNIFGLDLVKPSQEFSLSQYISYAQKIVFQSWAKQRLPMLVGGTGLYIKGVINPPATAAIPQNSQLRAELENMSVGQLATKIQQLDPDKFNQMNQSDRHNPRRLIRAIEVAEYLNNNSEPELFYPLPSDNLTIGLSAPLELIDQKIAARVLHRLNAGMVEEVKSLHLNDLDPHLPAAHTLGYQQVIEYLGGKKTLAAATQDWITAEQQYARRQLTWFKKQPEIHWFDVTKIDFEDSVVGLVATWYSEFNEKS